MLAHTFPARAAACLAAAATLLACTRASPPVTQTSPLPPPMVRVSVDGSPRLVEPGTTLGELIRDARLHPRPGHLLSVTDEVLGLSGDPGQVTVNGHSAARRRLLRNGDRVLVVDGNDRVESLDRTVRDAGVRVGNPERTLAVYPTREITLRGHVSHALVSITERSLGKGDVPDRVALTFDDGPWPDATVRVLRILRRFHVRATFFMVGTQVGTYPNLVRKVVAAGHVIGNHSFDHPLTLEDLTPEATASEITKANTLLERAGTTPTLFRPPGGWYDDDLVQEARREGMRVVTWSVDPDDWRADMTAKEVTHAVLSKVEPGSIVVLHDGGGDAGHTIKALPAIIRGIRHRGLRLVAVPPHPL
jgi:chitin deacetylase